MAGILQKLMAATGKSADEIMELVGKKSNGGGLPPTVIDDGAGPIAARGNTLPAEIPPEVVGGPTPRVNVADNIIDAEIVPPKSTVSTMDAVREFGKNNKGKIAGGLTIAELARQMMSGGGDEPPIQPPMAPDSPEPEQILPDNYMDLANAEARDQGTVSEASSAAPAPKAGQVAGPSPASVPVEPTEDAEMMRLLSAQDADTQNQFLAGMLRAGTMGGAAIAGTKADYSGVEAIEKTAGENTRKVKEKQSFSKDQQALAKAKAEINDDKAMRDPNSDISKMTVGLAQQLGILKPGQKSSAMDLKNSGINLGTLMATIEAAKGRAAAASLARDSKASDKQTQMEFKAEEDRKKREDKRKITTEEIESRKRTIEDNITRARELVKKFGTVEATGPQAELLQGMLDEIAVDTAKIQDPDSVARPTEVQLVRRSLIPEELTGRMGMTNKTAISILDEFEKRIQERAATGYKVRGIEQPTDRVSPKDNNSGEMVKVLPPGGTKPKLIPKSQLKSALDAGGKLVQ